jgi:predicted metalloprotease with PDZ domain
MNRALSVHLLLPLLLIAASASGAEPGRPIELTVDASEAPRKLVHSHLVIPAAPGPLTLYYPKWIQGEHSPTGPINDLSGLRIRAGDKTLAWRRDDLDLYAFHCTVPQGADAVEVSFDYLGGTGKDGFSASNAMTPRLAILNWHLVLLYPKGRPVQEQQIHASLKVPPGWKLGTALPIEANVDGLTRFKTVSLEMLADSPVLTGQHFKEIPLGPSEGPPHFLVLACDSAAGLAVSDKVKEQYERLVAEAGALFGSRHYRSYRFLVSLTEHFGHDAIEHHECSDNRMPERMFLDDSYRKLSPAWVLPHEYVHSWNGKYRRPEGLATSDFQQPMRTKLLWVYEGLTEYLGYVLTARSGLHTPEAMHDICADIADWAGRQQGRTWRPLEDTAVAAPFLYFARPEWASRRRGVDFYDEGALLWLDVDTLIREKTAGKKSLDDFCHIFHGGKGGAPEVKPYAFEDVVAALNEVVAHDWKALLEKRVMATAPEPPLEGLKRSGWKVIYKDTASDLLKARDEDAKTIDLSSSIGLFLKDDGQVTDVIPGKAADKAGIAPGMKLLAIDSRRWSKERLHEALEATTKGEKMHLLFENEDFFKSFTLDYKDGERYPHLERDGDKPDILSEIFAARAKK